MANATANPRLLREDAGGGHIHTPIRGHTRKSKQIKGQLFLFFIPDPSEEVCVCVLILHTDAISARMTQTAQATEAMSLWKIRNPGKLLLTMVLWK